MRERKEIVFESYGLCFLRHETSISLIDDLVFQVLDDAKSDMQNPLKKFKIYVFLCKERNIMDLGCLLQLSLTAGILFLYSYRCREKQRKEASRLQAVNRKLTAMNKLLMEENDRLQKQVSQLVYENGYFRQQTQNVRN